jgi:outer membrane protein assembly factor BamB
MRRITLVLLGLSVVAVVAALVFVPADVRRALRMTIRSTFQEEPDYDRLEADRAARATVEVADDAAPAPTWIAFRGPGQRGEYAETPIATEWPAEGLPLLWRQPVGAGYGSLTVAEGLVYALEQRREEEALVAYALASGAEVWVHAWPGRFDELMSGEGPRSTPVWADGAVYALGAAGELRCVTADTGELRWRADALELAGCANLVYGLAASPLVHGDLVIVTAGEPGANGATVLAVERASGEVRWRALDETASYASPFVAQLGERTQLLTLTSDSLNGLDPADGEALWSFPWRVSQDLTCSQPIVVDAERVLLSGGYGKGAVLVRVTHAADAWSAEPVWSALTMKNRFNSSVLHEGHVYGLDEGILACVDAATGKRVWKGGRYGYGQLLLAQGHLVVVSEDGDLVLLPATPEGHRELHRFRALEGLTFNVPAAAHGRLLLRNKLELACYELSAPRSR